VKVVPGASRAGLAGAYGEGVRVRVASPPERGRANEELLGLLATALGVPQETLRLVRGASSPRKTVHVTTLAPAEVAARLETAR
jgi:uncharacterized protein (TIGR00251 family)